VLQEVMHKSSHGILPKSLPRFARCLRFFVLVHAGGTELPSLEMEVVMDLQDGLRLLAFQLPRRPTALHNILAAFFES